MTKGLALRFIIAFMVVGYLTYWYYHFTNAAGVTTTSADQDTEYITDSTEEAASSSLPDEQLPYYEYRRVKDSIDRINQWRNTRNRFPGERMSTVFIGFASAKECDTCIWPPRFEEGNTPRKYYLSLPGYRLEENCTFIAGQGNYFIRHVKWDKETKKNGKTTGRWGHAELTTVPYRLAADGNDTNETTVLIPIEKVTYTGLKVAIIIFIILALFFMVYVFISLPVGLLIRIYKGDIFNHQTIREIKFIGWTLVLLPIVAEVCKQLARLIFYRYTHSPFISLPFVSSLLTDGWKSSAAGLALLILAKAFHHGYSLRRDHDLTI